MFALLPPLPQKATPEMALVILIGVASAIYLLPTMIALARAHHQRAAIIVVNLFAGWTLFGWVGSFAWAFTRVERTAPDGQVVRQDVTFGTFAFWMFWLFCLLLAAAALTFGFFWAAANKPL